MLAVAIAALIGSAATAYLIGYALVAGRDSSWRTKKGMWALAMLALSALPLPPQLALMQGAAAPLAGTPGASAVGALSLPSAIDGGAYILAWALTSVAGLLAGMRIWNAGKPGWRGGSSLAYDASSASRVTSLLPLADTLGEALEALAGARVSPKDVERVSGEIRNSGRRFAGELPPTDGAVYALVARRLPADVAARVTGFLLEGAGRRSRRA